MHFFVLSMLLRSLMKAIVSLSVIYLWGERFELIFTSWQDFVLHTGLFTTSHKAFYNELKNLIQFFVIKVYAIMTLLISN